MRPGTDVNKYLGEVVDSGEFQEGRDTIAKTANDEPVESGCVMDLGQISSTFQGDRGKRQHSGDA